MSMSAKQIGMTMFRISTGPDLVAAVFLRSSLLPASNFASSLRLSDERSLRDMDGIMLLAART